MEFIDTKLANARYILDELLCIPNAEDKIKIVDTNRLPQTKVTMLRLMRQARPVCRPVGIKVSTAFEVGLIYDHLKNLATVNEGKETHERVYCTKHLPKEMQRQRKAQVAKFRKARREDKDVNLKLIGIQLIIGCISTVT